MGKKQLLANFLYGTALIRIVIFFNRFFSNRLLVLAYHRIYDIEPLDDHSFSSDIELISASSREFDWQIQYLKKHYSVVTFETYAEILKSNKNPRDLVIVSFDDGFIDNYKIAFPILRRHEVPAVFYISVDYIDSDKPFWFEYVVSLLRQIPQEYVREVSKILRVKEFISDRNKIAADALENLKKISNRDRLSIISALNNFCEKQSLVLTNPDSKAMTWDQVLEMADCGMEIGSHTLTHPVLANLSKNEIVYELADSKRQIEQRINKTCSSLSYPNGRIEDFNETVLKAANDSGYKFACSYISGANTHVRLEKYQLKRLHVERYTDKSYFASMLALPSVFS